MRLLKQLLVVFAVLAVLASVLVTFTYDVIKIDWPSFMEIQPSFKPMENPLPVPARSVPVEGAAYIPTLGVPENPVAADDVSIARGAELYQINCKMCHGEAGKGNGPIAPFLVNFKPADLTSPAVQFLSNGAIFMTITNGKEGRMPALNENFTVRERWDIVNFVRTLKK
jgi:mono/diheme cytochrome c family protein